MKVKNLFKLTIGLLLCLIIFGFVHKVQKEVESTYNIITVRKVDTDGKVHLLGVENKKAYPVTLVFLEVGCVISQRMVQSLNEISQEAEQKGVRFYGVISNSKATWQEAQSFKKEFDIQFPLLFDSNGDLAKEVNPTVVPECFVFDIEDQLVYHGRINDSYVAVGKTNRNIRNNDLLDAVRSVATGITSNKEHQTAIGCVFEPWTIDPKEVSYSKHIEPIIRANCVSCHKPNDIGPFSLQTYNEVSRRGRVIEFVTRKKYMPIWKGEKGFGKFANEHTLSDYEIDLISQWVKTGMNKGDDKDLLPKQTESETKWKLGEPDLVLEMEPYNLPANGDDQYRVFVMKNKIPKGKVIRAIDFKPGDPEVVHHSTIFVDYTGRLSQFDKEDPQPGYDAFKKGGTMEFGSAVPICGWAPGVGVYSYPDDVGFYVEQNATLAFENHYHLTGKPTTDKSYIGIYYADKPIKKYVTGSIIGTQKLQIPANTISFKKSIWTYVPTDIELYDLTPHMHYIGKSVSIEVLMPNGSTKKLLKLNDWDLRWQSVYTLRELTLIPKGSIIKADFEFDNSDDNADNPNYPSEEIYWGWGSEDEMCEVYFSYILVSNKDYGKMLASSFASFDHFYPYTERVDVHEQNINAVAKRFFQCDVWSDDGQKLLISILESRLKDQVMLELNGLKKGLEKDPRGIVNLAELSLGDAFISFDESLKINEARRIGDLLYKLINSGTTDWDVHYSYARIMLSSGIDKYEKEGERVLIQLVDAQEKLTKESKFSKAYCELV